MKVNNYKKKIQMSFLVIGKFYLKLKRKNILPIIKILLKSLPKINLIK